MQKPLVHSNVQELERAFLRKAWWLFPAVGALASLLIGGPFWAWVAGQSSVLPWTRLFSLRAAAWALAFLGLPMLWRAGLRFRPSGIVVGGLALGIVLVAEGLLRSPWIQAPLWLATRARLAEEQSFMREVCYVRLEESAGRRASSPAVVLVGSSQVLKGVDDGLLRELIKPTPVIRRATGGMSPLKALAMRSCIPFRPEDVCVLYLSEFDFTNQDEFPYAWFRPFASWASLPATLECIPPAVTCRHWRQLADYALAATTEWWRVRDFLRQLVFRFWRLEPPAAIARPVSGPPAGTPEPQAVSPFSTAEWKAFQRFARDLAQERVRLLVFEGDVNPALHSPARLQAKAHARELLSKLDAQPHAGFVSLEAQALALGAEHWSDMTHLNAEGRQRLTRRMAQELLRKQ